MLHFALTILLCTAHAVQFNEAFLGTWLPVNHSTPHAIIGPSGVLRDFAMTHDKKNNEYWMAGIIGQVFRIKSGLMQYCFARMASSPFVVDSSTDNKIVFCYKTGQRMHSHKATATGLATGCDAAQIVLELHDNGILEFTFYMSPPVKHAWILLKRTGPSPPLDFYKVSNIFGGCDPTDPPPPTLASTSASRSASLDELSSMCPSLAMRKQESSDAVVSSTANGSSTKTRCRQLGTFLQGLITKEAVDIRLQYMLPTKCWPCKVSYSVSAKIPEDKYISIAFKGMGYRFYEGMIPGSHKGSDRPNYFGMGTDPIDEERTGTVMVTGYPSTSGGCVREMKAEHYAGLPTDVEGNPHVFDTSVERKNGRTILRFSVEQHVGKNEIQCGNFFGLEQDSARIAWAIGDVRPQAPTPGPTPAPAVQHACKACAHVYDPIADGDGMAFEDLPADTWTCPVCGQPKSVYEPVASTPQFQGECGEAIMMHMQGQRGVSPLEWFFQHPFCDFDADEYGHIEQTLV